MKQLWKTEDRAINNLLRLQMGRRGGTGALCKEFDPDLANSYVERVMTTGARARYEQHIAECAACRKSTVALIRMAGDAMASRPDAARPALSRLAWLNGVFASPGAQRWAVPAIAVLALALAIPLILSRKDAQVNQAAIETNSVAGAQSSQRSEGDLAVNKADQTFISPAADAPLAAPRQSEQSQNEAARMGQPESDQPATPSGAIAAGPPQIQLVDANVGTTGSNEAARSLASEAQLAARTSDVGPPPVAEEKLSPLDTKTALRLPEQNKDSTHTSTLKPGRIDGEQKEKEMTATIKPEDAIAPPPETPAPSGFISRRLADGSVNRFKTRGNNRESSNRRGLEERRVSGKKFYLIRGVWTDKDYNPDKEMPLVPIIRDSDVYKDVLAKRGGLRAFFSSFATGEQVIVVYKGTVYKLIPQEIQK